MRRRSFLQSLLAGGAALTLPTVTRTVEAEPKRDGDRGGSVLEQVFELHESPSRPWGYGVEAIGMQVTVPAGGRARVVIQPPKEIPVRVVNLAAHPEGGQVLTANVPEVFHTPVDVRVFATEDCAVPLDGPVSTKDRPFVIELESHSGEDTDLAVVAYFMRIPVGQHPPPLGPAQPTAHDHGRPIPAIDIGPCPAPGPNARLVAADEENDGD